MKSNALVIGVSKLEFVNILLTYYPKNVNETFDVYLFIDDKKVTHEQIKEIIANHNIRIFNEAIFINISDMYDYYTEKHGYQGRAKQMVYTQGCIFKILAPIYLYEKYGVTRVYTSDDDVFIFNDLSYMFEKYKGFAIKKENLFSFKNKDKYEVLAAYNEIFDTDFTIEQMNSLSVNAGNVMYEYDPMMEEYVKRFINHPMVHHLFYDFDGYVSWTIEQRWQHFNLHRLMKENKTADLLEGQDLRLIVNIDKEAYLNDTQPIYLKQVTPSLLHYAVGAKKPIFLRQFLQGIEWKFGFRYEPKYELKDILYNKSWVPPVFKDIQKQLKGTTVPTKKTTAVF
jgi:hypothetical protein